MRKKGLRRRERRDWEGWLPRAVGVDEKATSRPIKSRLEVAVASDALEVRLELFVGDEPDLVRVWLMT